MEKIIIKCKKIIIKCKCGELMSRTKNIGKDARCFVCKQKTRRKWYLKNKDKLYKQQKEYREKNNGINSNN